MLPDDERHIPVKFRNSRQRFAEGGLARAAEDVRSASRYGDEFVVHVNRREFEDMVNRWGEPTINPETGLPEFFDLKDLWNDTKDWIVPVAAGAAGAFLPGIGQAVGSFLPGAADFLGAAGTQALATGLLGAGAGYLTNGGKGALLGGLAGAAGAYGGDLLRNGMDGSALGSMLAASAAGGGAGSGATNIAGKGMGGGAIAPALLMAALNMAGNAFGGDDEAAAAGEAAFNDAQEQNSKPLPTWENKRKRRVYAYNDVPDYTTQGERTYFDNNNFAEGGRVKDQERLPEHDPPYIPDLSYIDPLSWLGYALGLQQEYPEVVGERGDLEGYEEGGAVSDGRADDIEALLSHGEYVIDAETVALLGNGSPEAGAERLDAFRENIRKHKGSALAAGQISPDALPPEQYIT